MKLFYIILTLLFSTGTSRSQNILDVLGQKPNVKKEQKVLKKFKESDCYKDKANYKIQPHHNYLVQPLYIFQLKRWDENILTNESLFLKNLRGRKTSLNGYTIFNDSLQNVAFSYKSCKYFYCNYRDDENTLDSASQYAIENQYALFFVDGFPGNIRFAYKDGHLVVLENQFWDDGSLKVYSFEEFDWEKPYLLQWKEFLPVLHR